MKKAILFILLAIFFIVPIASAVTPDQSYWYQTIYQQQSPVSNTIVFSNQANTTQTISILKDKSWITLSTNSLSISPFSTAQLTVTISPSGLQPDFYTGYVNYSADTSGSIGIFLTVQKNVTTGCALVPLITDYITKIQQGTASFTKTFSIQVSKSCSSAIIIQKPITIGTIQTTEGEKPVSLTGSLSLGSKNPGESASFDVEFNTKGMSVGTYQPKILIIGLDSQGEKVQTDINIEVTVVGGDISPEVNITTPPTYDIPAQVTAGQTFSIVARNVNPNLQPYLFPNPYIYGEGVELSGSNWILKMRTNKTGSVTVQLATLYKGMQIGGVTEKSIIVMAGGTLPAGSEMKFDFYPSLENLKDKETLNILLRDKASNNIVSAVIYVNGIQISNSSIRVESGKYYAVSAVNPNYNTLDANFTIQSPKILIYISPEQPDIGDTVAVITKSDATSADVTASLKLDGQSVPKSFTVQYAGNHTIEASSNGYESASKYFVVGEPVSMTYSPPELKKGKNNTITFSKDTDYLVIYKTSLDTSTSENIASGIGSQIVFEPKKSGFYVIYGKGNLMKTYELKQGLSIPLKGNTIYYILIGIIVAAVLYFILKGRGGGKKRFGMFPTESPLTIGRG